ncbi:hypothetical protein ABZ942_00335 [Nocardia sp. NPDC046473]|uniref:hypothetical protein n=1 Tax=Nocardia sp. NPDC046473 TaxID=3155733 RepID=UPI0033EBAFB4
MDHHNRFQSITTYRLLRLEFGIGLIASLWLFVDHIGEVRWIPAIILFFYIDLFGYIPGMIAHLRSKTGDIPKVYYVLYNTMHSAITQSAVVGVWALVYGWEWALLVIPIHLCGDRALFGNFMKSFQVPFEPKKLPAFAEFEERLATQFVPSRQAMEGV